MDLLEWGKKHVSQSVAHLDVQALAYLYVIKVIHCVGYHLAIMNNTVFVVLEVLFQRDMHTFQAGAEKIFLPGYMNMKEREDMRTPVMFDNELETALSPESEAHFDLAEHFGCTRLNNQTKGRHNSFYRLCHNVDVAMQVQIIVPQDSSSNTEDILCDPKAPPVILPSQILARYKFGQIHVGKSAFWALPFVCRNTECSPTKSAIFVMMTQRLLWLSGKELAVLSLKWMKTVGSEYSDLDSYERLIRQWMCNSETSKSCIQQIVALLAEKRALSQNDEKNIEHWLQALSQIAYDFSGR